MQREVHVERSGTPATRLRGDFRTERLMLAVSVALGVAGMLNFGGRFEATIPHVVQFAAVGVAAAAQYAVYGLVLRYEPRLQRHGAGLLVAICCLFTVTALVVYPAVDSRPNSGNDNDDALTIGVRALQHGDDPYALRTYHGLPVAPLPGGFVLAAPAVLSTARSGATTLLALVAFALTLRLATRGDRAGLVLVGLLFAATPTVWLSLANGNDELAVGLWALTAAGLLLREPAALPRDFASAALSAVMLCTRTFVGPILLPLFALLWRARNPRTAGARTLAFGAGGFLLLLPFAWRILDGNFPPLEVVAENKRASIELAAPLYFGIIVGGLLTAVVLTWRALETARDELIDRLLARWALMSWMIVVVPFAAVVILSPRHLQSASYFNAVVPLALALLVLNMHREVSESS